MHLPSNQRVRRVSALRRWHQAVSVAAPRLLRRHVPHLRCSLGVNVQEQARIRSYKHFRAVRGALSDQWHLLVHLCSHASDPCHQHSTRSMAAGTHCLWRLLLCNRTSHSVRLQRYHLQQRATLSRWTFLCHDM